MPFIIQGKTNWIFILIVFVVAVFAGGGILFYLGAQEDLFSDLSEAEVVKRVEVDEEEDYEEIEEISEEKIIGWEIYRNEELGFELKHPSGISVRQLKPYGIWNDDLVRGGLFFIRPLASPFAEQLDIVIFNNPRKLSLENWVSQDFFPPYIEVLLDSNYRDIFEPEYRKTKIGNYDALVTDDNIPVFFPKVFIISAQKDFIGFFRDGYGYGIHGFSEEEFNQIISTFRFLE